MITAFRLSEESVSIFNFFQSLAKRPDGEGIHKAVRYGSISLAKPCSPFVRLCNPRLPNDVQNGRYLNELKTFIGCTMTRSYLCSRS
jgi:hypothetical protein